LDKASDWEIAKSYPAAWICDHMSLARFKVEGNYLKNHQKIKNLLPQ